MGGGVALYFSCGLIGVIALWVIVRFMNITADEIIWIWRQAGCRPGSVFIILLFDEISSFVANYCCMKGVVLQYAKFVEIVLDIIRGNVLQMKTHAVTNVRWIIVTF